MGGCRSSIFHASKTNCFRSETANRTMAPRIGTVCTHEGTRRSVRASIACGGGSFVPVIEFVPVAMASDAEPWNAWASRCCDLPPSPVVASPSELVMLKGRRGGLVTGGNGPLRFQLGDVAHPSRLCPTGKFSFFFLENVNGFQNQSAFRLRPVRKRIRATRREKIIQEGDFYLSLHSDKTTDITDKSKQ